MTNRILEVESNILELLQPMGECNFKIISHPFSPTDETVRQSQIIDLEYTGEKIDSTTNRRLGGGGRHIQIATMSFNINVWVKTSRKLNHRLILEHLETLVQLVAGKSAFKNQIGLGDIIYEGTEKVEKDTGDFFHYRVKVSVKYVRG